MLPIAKGADLGFIIIFGMALKLVLYLSAVDVWVDVLLQARGSALFALCLDFFQGFGLLRELKVWSIEYQFHDLVVARSCLLYLVLSKLL